jgi:hypothetical protein
MILTLILLAVFVTVTAALWKEGIWSSLVMLLNVVLAATVATAWYEKLVAVLEPRLPSFTYLLDFVALWGLFCLLLLGLREATDRISRTRVKLRRPVELFGGPLVAALVGWVMICFTAATLHTAPVPRDVVQPTPEARMFFGLAPDRRWLAWVRGSSLRGPFARPVPDDAFASPDHAFDSHADFILRYASRRHALEAEPALRVRPK